MNRLKLLVSTFVLFAGVSAVAAPGQITGYVCSGVEIFAQKGSSDTGGTYGNIGTQINSAANCGGSVVASLQYYSTGTTVTNAYGFSESALNNLYNRLIQARDAGRFLRINCSDLTSGSCIGSDLYFY